MEDLLKQKCEACRADAPRVTDDELPELLKQIPDWQPVTKDSILMLNRVFKFDDYAQSLDFTQKIAALAEEEDHHCLLYTSPSPRDVEESRMPSSA